jgi:hypothetical protein
MREALKVNARRPNKLIMSAHGADCLELHKQRAVRAACGAFSATATAARPRIGGFAPVDRPDKLAKNTAFRKQ